MSSTKVAAYLTVDVDFDYQPKEEPDRGPEARYPGCPESIAINRVTLGDFDITKTLTDDDMAGIEDAIWEDLT